MFLVSKCCFFLSPRIGLIVWGCSKLIIDSTLILCLKIYLERGLLVMEEYNIQLRSYRDTLVITSLVLVAVVVDAVQHGILVAGAFKRNIGFLKEYYIFAIIWWIFIAIVGLTGISITIKDLSKMYSHSDLGLMFFDILALLVYLGIHGYFLLLVRSEVITLNTKQIGNSTDEPKRKSQFT